MHFAMTCRSLSYLVSQSHNNCFFQILKYAVIPKLSHLILPVLFVQSIPRTDGNTAVPLYPKSDQFVSFDIHKYEMCFLKKINSEYLNYIDSSTERITGVK
jgi:hypothetical protein